MKQDDHDELKAIRELAESFARTVVAARASDIDESEEFPYDILDKMRELGFLSLTVPEDLGGAGLGLEAVAAVAEELGRVDVSTACSFNSHTSCCALIGAVGTPAQRANLLGRVAEGALVSMALSEPGAGSDAASLRTTVREDGDDYVLNGVKHYCTNADVADILLIFATSAPGSGAAGISVFAVDADNPGLTIRRLEKKMGLHGTHTVEFELAECRVPKDRLLGSPGEGFAHGMRALQRGRVAVAAIAVGAARGSLESALAHARSREQFGASIGDFQGMQFKLADMHTAVTSAALIVEHAIRSSHDPRAFALTSAQAKYFATDVAMQVTVEAVQVLGGAGYMRGQLVERMMRDVKVLQIFEGTNEVMRMLVGRHILKV